MKTTQYTPQNGKRYGVANIGVWIRTLVRGCPRTSKEVGEQIRCSPLQQESLWQYSPNRQQGCPRASHRCQWQTQSSTLLRPFPDVALTPLCLRRCSCHRGSGHQVLCHQMAQVSSSKITHLPSSPRNYTCTRNRTFNSNSWLDTPFRVKFQFSPLTTPHPRRISTCDGDVTTATRPNPLHGAGRP